MIGETATTSSRRPRSTSRTPGTWRIGSIEMSGFDGRDDDASRLGRGRASDLVGRAGRGRRPTNSIGRDDDVVVVAHEVLLEGEAALAR